MFESSPVRSIHNILQINNPSRPRKKTSNITTVSNLHVGVLSLTESQFPIPNKKDATKSPNFPQADPNRPHKHPNK